MDSNQQWQTLDNILEKGTAAVKIVRKWTMIPDLVSSMIYVDGRENCSTDKMNKEYVIVSKAEGERFSDVVFPFSKL